MNQLTITLKQHTPLIHFQYNQKGATLRASEVKPKLDKFIFSRLQETKEEQFEKHKHLLSGYSPDNEKRLKEKFLSPEPPYFYALDYKIRIVAHGVPKHYICSSYISSTKESEAHKARPDSEILNNSPYFAQQQEYQKSQWKDLSKEGIMHDKITVVFTSKHPEIIDLIAGCIQDFFVKFNFGTRQSKGFGCFSVSEISDSRYPVENNIEKLLTSNFNFVYKRTRPEISLSNVFKIINDDYKLIKSGKSVPYTKSMLMEYFYKQDIRWEKKFIKQNFEECFVNENNEPYHLLTHHPHNNDDDKENFDYEFVRALLGLPGIMEFQLENPAIKNGKMKVTITSCYTGNNEIARYGSPLIFKIYNNFIYIAGDETDPDIKGKKFKFLVNIDGDDGYENENIGTLSVPQNFNLKEFIKYAMNSNELKKNYKCLL